MCLSVLSKKQSQIITNLLSKIDNKISSYRPITDLYTTDKNTLIQKNELIP